MAFEWLTAATAIAPAAAQYFGQVDTNNQNAANSAAQMAFQHEEGIENTARAEHFNEEARSFAAGEADKTRKWSEQMRSTAYQSSMDDMRKAGLNPMLAGMTGPNSTPSGAQASAGSSAPGQGGSTQLPEVKSAIAAAVSTALQSTQLQNELKNSESQRNLNQAKEKTEQTLQDSQTASAQAAWTNAAKAQSETYLNNIEAQAREPESKARAAKATQDEKNAVANAWLEMGQKGAGALNSAAGAIRNLKGGSGPPPLKIKPMRTKSGDIFDPQDGELIQ